MTIRHHDLIEIAGDVEGETKLAYRFFDGDRHVWRIVIAAVSS